MKITTEKYLCDICESDIKENNSNIGLGLGTNVLFLTEQTEGRETKPYISYVNLDLCEECLERYKNSLIRARGAQGYNEYRF